MAAPILVVGLFKAQAAQVIRDFPHLDVRHHASDQTLTGLDKAAKAASHVILLTNYIDHKHQRVVEKHCSSVVLLRGGLTRLRQALAAAGACHA